MDILSYAKTDYGPEEEDEHWNPRLPPPSHRHWRQMGEELGAEVIPFSFWRSRLRKLLIPAEHWTIALDEVNKYHLRARALFQIGDFPVRFELATGRSNKAGAWIDSSIQSARHLERVWVEPQFDARCSVYTSSPVTMQCVLDDADLRSKILAHRRFILHCTVEAGASRMALLSLTVRPAGVDLNWAKATLELMYAVLRRLNATRVATNEGVAWTLGV